MSEIFLWIGFIVLILVFLIIDLKVFNKKDHEISIKEAINWTIFWFSIAIAFNLFIFLYYQNDSRPNAAIEFFTGYLIEKSLSVDNLFVILLIFLTFKIEPKYQHRILFWGIVGALIMRGFFIIVGAALVSRFEWVLYLFGMFLIYAGISLFFKEEENFDPHNHFAVRFIKKIVRVSKREKRPVFFTKENGKFAVTIFFVALVVIEFSDLIFAFDSIPAIFGITKDPFIVFTSNIFAILGLRSLYFVIAKIHKYFSYLSMGLAIILIFIGLKMLLEKWVHISVFFSLGVIVSILTIFILASIFLLPDNVKKRRQKEKLKNKCL